MPQEPSGQQTYARISCIRTAYHKTVLQQTRALDKKAHLLAGLGVALLHTLPTREQLGVLIELKVAARWRERVPEGQRGQTQHLRAHALRLEALKQVDHKAQVGRALVQPHRAAPWAHFAAPQVQDLLHETRPLRLVAGKGLKRGDALPADAHALSEFWYTHAEGCV